MQSVRSLLALFHDKLWDARPKLNPVMSKALLAKVCSKDDRAGRAWVCHVGFLIQKLHFIASFY